MDYLKELPLEFSKPFAICFDLLAKANISIHDQKCNIQRKMRYLLLLVCYFTFYASLVISFSKVFTGDLGFYELANLLPIVIVATQGAMKGTVIITNLAKARTLIDELGAMWRTSGLTRNQLTRKGLMLKRLNLCNAVFYWMNIVGTWQYILVPLFETMFRTFVLGQDKLLFPFICTFPFDATQNWLVYLVTYFYESYSMLHLIYMYLGVEFLMITLCSHLATEFELLREEILHARPGLQTFGAMDDVDRNDVEINDDYVDNNEDDVKNYDIIVNVDDDIKVDEDTPFINDVIRRHQKLIKYSQKN